MSTHRFGLTVALALLFPILAPGGAAGQTTAPPAAGGPAVTLTLEDSLRAALQRAPEVRGAEAELEGILGKEMQAIGLGYPQAQVTTVLGPSPRARGDQVSSPDKKYELNITGIFLRADLAIIQPIFTWGLIDNARQAAKHGVRATEAGVDVKSTEVALKVKQAYWGLVTTTAIRDFLLDLSEQVDKAVERTERLIEGGFTTESDVYRLRANRGELDKNLHLVEKLRDLARAALAVWTGQPAGTSVEAADKVLPSDLGDPRALELYLEDAQGKRPEFIQLREGIQARQNLVEVERKQRYPLFFIGLVGAAAYATNRDRIDNPFVYDPLNDAYIGPVIGFKYSLDFGIAAGKIKEAEAEVHKLEALRQYAEEGIPLQVRDAYGTVVEAQRNARALDQANLHGRRWLVSASSNFDLGVGEPRDLADAFVVYGKTRGEYLQALYAYVYGLAQLAHASGLDVEEVRRLVPPAARPKPGQPAGGKR